MARKKAGSENGLQETGKDATETKAAPKAEGQVKLVKMARGNQSADVHPEMVAEYERGGWVAS